MKGALALVAALALTGCHRQSQADVTLDADQDARNAAQAKIDADLAAADAAARVALPARRTAPKTATPVTPAPDETPADTGDAAVPDNTAG